MLYIYAIYLYYMWIDTLWIYSMSTLENTDESRTFLFVQHTTSILAKYNTWYFERSGDISCSVLVNQSHTDESWEVRNTCLWIDTLWTYSLSTQENTDENRMFLFVHHTTSILAKLSTWCFEHSGDISCSLLVNPSQTDESWEGRNTCLWIYTLWTYWLSTLENTDENKIFFVRSSHHKHFGKAQHMVLWALWWHQLFSTR